MSALDTLRPGQQGVLALLLRRGQSYDELAGTLDTSAHVVTEMARSAVRSVAPPGADVAAASLDRLSDYVLGQLPPREVDDVTAELERFPAARDWVRQAVSTLGPLYEAVTPPPVPVESERDDAPRTGMIEGAAEGGGAPAPDRDGARDGRRLRRVGSLDGSGMTDHESLDGSALARDEPGDGSRLRRAEPAGNSGMAHDEPLDGSALAPDDRPRLRRVEPAGGRLAHDGARLGREEPDGPSPLPTAERERPGTYLRRTRRRLLLLLGALALLLAAVGLWGASRDDQRARRPSPTAAPAADQRTLVERQVTLEPARGETGAGIIAVSRSGAERQLVVQARLRPSRPGERYELWLYRTKTAARSLGARPTDPRGNYRAAVPLPADYATYPSVDLSRETDPRPQHSGDSVLRAALGAP